MNDEIAIRLCDVSKKYNLYNRNIDRLKESLNPFKKKYHDDFFAVKNISLEVKKGEILGIVGKNGSGKSTLLSLISGVLSPTEGTIAVNGNIVALLELGTGFNPDYTGMENIYFYSALMGYTREQIHKVIDDIIDFAELEQFIYQPLKTYSSGMRARLAFAVSVNIQPDILVLDEVLSVGDELFRRKCYARMEEFFKGGKTILYVSHDARTVNQLCTSAIFLDRGELLLEGPTKMVTMNYQKFLLAKKENIAALRLEITELNKNKELKMNYEDKLEIMDDYGIIKKNTMDFTDEVVSINNFQEQHHDYKYTNDYAINELFYIVDFIPKTTLHTGNNILIEDCVLLDKNELKVNVLEFDETYVLKYKIVFLIDAVNVKFGVQIKNINGILISGANSQDYSGIYLERVEKGKKFVINYSFHCLLTNGTYYTNVFVDNETEPAVIYDANVFKVVIPSKIIFGGDVSLEQQITYKEII